MSSESRILDRIESIIRINNVLVSDLSRDDRYALLVSDVTGSPQLSSLELRSGKTVQVSHGDQRVPWAQISPDSKRVAFIRDFGGAERHQFFLAPIDGRKTEEQISNLQDTRIFGFEWSPNGKEIALSGSTAKSINLWSYNVGSGSIETLYSVRGWTFSPAWNRDGSRLAASAKTTDKPRSAELIMVNRKNGEVESYTPAAGSENSVPRWHPRKERLLFKTNAMGNYDLAIYDYTTRKLSYLNIQKLGYDFVNFDWIPDGEGIWFVAAKNGRTRLYVRKRGKMRRIQTPVGRISTVKQSHDGSFFVFAHSSLSQPLLVAKIELASGKMTPLYGPSHATKIKFGKSRFLTYKSFDGRRIPAYVVFAEGSETPRACVVWPHGGPWWEVADEWNAPIQAISSAGFHVFCPNFRGSTGYGAEFERMSLGDPGGADLQDVVYGTKYVMERGWVEDSKVGIAGASYGGFMTFIGMTKVPDLWKAGAAIVGVTDWKEMYDLSDASFKNFVEAMVGNPEENAELCRDRSAINFVHQLKSPILIWHRANDSRCPLKPVQRFAEKLKEQGTPHEFHVVEGEGHGPQKTDNLVKQYRHVVAFLLKNLK